MSAVSNQFTVRVVNPVLPAWLAGAARHQVVVVPGSNLSSPLYASVRATAYHGSIGNIVDAWGGAFVRDAGSHYGIHGGGHQDYAGNEIYTIRLADDAPAWVRRWGPTPSGSFANNLSVPFYNDGNPASVHTYFRMFYEPAQDRVLRLGRATYASSPVQFPDSDAWLWSDATETYNTPAPASPGHWHLAPIATLPIVATQSPSFYARDYVSGDLFAVTDTALHRLPKNASAWVSGPAGVTFRGGPMVFSPSANRLIGFNNSESPQAGRVWVVDFAAGTRAMALMSGNAGSIAAMSSAGNGSSFAGAAVDRSSGLIYYCSTGGAIHTLNPVTLEAQPVATTGASIPTPQYGPIGRFQFVPELSGFALLPSWGTSVHFFRTI